jgi:hypothetical protein
MEPQPPRDREFEELASARQPSLISELIEFLRDNKKWWLIPILAVLAVFGLVAFLASSSVGPFIYALF